MSVTPKDKADFVLVRLTQELQIPIFIRILNTNHFEFKAGNTVELGKTSLRVDGHLGDCLFGHQSGAFSSREVCIVLMQITEEYNEKFGTYC